MANFQYTALLREGAPLQGAISAESRQQAIARLAMEGRFVTDIRESDQVSAWQGLALLGNRRRVAPRLRVALLEQLATALQSGLPLLSALRAAEQQAETRRLRELIKQLADRVQGGESFSSAIAAQPEVFSRLEISMARVGETAGVLDQVMGYMADLGTRDLEIREKIRSAATYPLFVLGLALLSAVVILAWILPRILEAVGDTVPVLPLPTRILMSVSGVLQGYWWLLIAVIAVSLMLYMRWHSQPAGRLAVDRLKLRIPVIGPALRKIAIGRFARTLGILSKSGVPILESLHVLRDTLGNEMLAQKIDSVAAGIRQGESIAEPLARTGEFPPLLTQVIALGERTGRLDELLLRAAATFERESTASVQRLMTLLPAILIVLLAFLVGFILLSVLWPIVDMQTSIPNM